MTDHFFSHGILQKKDPRPIKCSMEPGQCCVRYTIALPGLHCVSVWSGMPRRGFRAHLSLTSYRQPSAFSCQAHLDCFTCAGDPVVRCSSVCVELLVESKKSGVQHWCVRKRWARCRTYNSTDWEDLRTAKRRFFGELLVRCWPLFCVVTYSIITTECCRTSKWGFVVGVWRHLWPRIKTDAFYVVVIDFIMSYLV